ncbi:MAG TPA: N-methyl-L-tryptophan oxidase [Chloroflexi bacterium]|jgi:sarcosine oxidase|nr:N-methyl-L-tryptophan oxidase [Chloroflexota bacterium]HAL25693.1 N-methyl-L-tryptophan oxidase [Chloroflexota bacterium]
MTDAIVIGLGADGSAAAAHLAGRGARVLGLEAFARGHTNGSSGGLTRVIRLAYYEHPDYVPLLKRAWQLWRDLEAATGEQLLKQTGGVYVGPRDGELVGGSLRSAREHGLEHELLDPAGLRARLPLFRFDADWWGLAEATAGYLLPDRCIAAHLALAERHEAELRFEERVLSWARDGGGVRVTTDRGTHRAAKLVIAAGAWNARLLPAIAPLLQVKRVPLFWFEPVAERDALATLPVYIVDSGLGHGCYGFPYLADQGLKIATHGAGTPADPDTVDREAHPDDELPIRAFIKDRLPVADGPVRMTKICMYTVTPDEHFIVDVDEPVAYASACSGHGFKFASVMGEVLADLALEGTTRHPIGFLSASRFAAARA